MTENLTKKTSDLARFENLTQLDLTVIDSLNWNPHTAKIRRTAVKQFNKFLAAAGLSLTPQAIQDFLVNSAWRGSTRNLKRDSLKKVIELQPQYRNNYVFQAAISEVFKTIKRVKIQPGLNTDCYLTAAEVQAVQEKASPKLSLIIEFLFRTGLRISELINLKISDLKINGKVKLTVIGKGNKERSIFTVCDLVERIKSTFESETYLFETRTHTPYDRKNLLRDIKAAGRLAGFEIHPHTLRHSCAMLLKSRGASVQQIQLWLGHSTSQITIDNYFHDQIDSKMADLF